ncbi:DUF6325 family protein [Gordonia sp. CPCC 205515]|uniref:DUF6325 family protein n=1 Tax=Gordonia sp. CPCC 205515 TaxID=3140791 RepID=UPI003AF3AF0E
MRNGATLGPIDYVVIEFSTPADIFTDRLSGEIISLVESGLVRVLDLLVVSRTASGSIEVSEFEEFDGDRLGILHDSLAEILALEDVENLAAAIEPGRCAAVIVWEYLCALPFTRAAQDAGAQVVAQGRIPQQAIVATLEADERSPAN